MKKEGIKFKENAIDKIFKKTIHPKMNQNQAFR